MATMDQLIAGLRAADAAGNSADAHAFAQAIEKMRSGAPAATAPSDQPSMWDRIAASPAGRFAQENIVQLGLNAGAQVAGGIAAGPLGADVTQAAVQKYLAQPEEQAYQAALARNRNVPGYAQLRQQANQVQDKTGYGFGSEMFSTLQPAVSGLAAMATNGGSLSAANAGADATSQARQQYEQQNPWLSLGANVLGGLLMARPVGAAEGVAGASRALGEIPTEAGFRTASGDDYAAVRNSGLRIDPEAVKNLAGGIRSELTNKGFDPRLSNMQNINLAVQDLQDKANAGPVSLQDLDITKRIANQAAQADGSASGAAGFIRNALDKFIKNLTPDDVVGGDLSDRDALASARRNWQLAEKVKVLDDANARALNRVGANYTSAGYQTALRQEFKRIANDEYEMNAFTPDEQDMILKIVRGQPMENFLRRIGKMIPTHGFAGTLMGAASYASGGLPGLAVPAAGMAADMAATRMALSNVRGLNSMVRGGGVMPPAQPVLGSPSLPATLPYGSLMTPLLLQQRRPQQYQ